jgi:hypothetical protein
LAVTTYSNIIDIAPSFKQIPDDDQGYLVAARQEEMPHYLLEQSVTDRSTPFTQFFYLPKMFSDAQTTLNISGIKADACYPRRMSFCLSTTGSDTMTNYHGKMES